MNKNIITESKLSETNSELLYLKNELIPQLEHQIEFLQSKEHLTVLMDNYLLELKDYFPELLYNESKNLLLNFIKSSTK
jgi:hypothetical protein